MTKTLIAAMAIGFAGAFTQVQASDPFLVGEGSAAKPLVEGTPLTLISVVRPMPGRDGMYIETGSMRRTGDIADAWMLAAYVKPRTALPDHSYDGDWLSVRFNCVKHSWQLRAKGLVDADGKTHDWGNRNYGEARIRRDGYFDYGEEIACGRWNWKLSGAGLPGAAEVIAEVRKPVPPDYQEVPPPPPPSGMPEFK